MQTKMSIKEDMPLVYDKWNIMYESVICSQGNKVAIRDMEHVQIHVSILKEAAILDLCKLKCIN